MRISESMRYKLFQSCINKVGQQVTDIEKRIAMCYLSPDVR
jgi:hypothetical protein